MISDYKIRNKEFDMTDYQIFSDSSCDMPSELLTDNDITLIPFYVTFDKENYFKENIEITNSKFYDVLMNEKVFPKTSLPSVVDYMNHRHYYHNTADTIDNRLLAVQV